MPSGTPALLTSTSIGPSAATADATPAPTAAPSVTSKACARALAAAGADLRRDALGALGDEVVHGDRCAARGERARDARADALAAARDERHPATEIEHREPPKSWRPVARRAMLARPSSMFATQLEQLLSLLDLERIEENLFRGVSPQNGRDRIFGGQVLAQGLVAAGRTAPRGSRGPLAARLLPAPRRPEASRSSTRSTASATAAASPRAPCARSSAARRSSAWPSRTRRRTKASSTSSRAELPGEPAGEPYEDAIRREIARHGVALEADDRRFDLPLEVRTLGGLHFAGAKVEAPRTQTWMRTRGAVGDDLRLHQCLLAYASDLTLLVSAVKPHPVGLTTPGFRTASLDHAMWFHRPFRIDDWLLYVQDSPISARSRGFARGAFYTRTGELVASCAQEGVLRYRPPGKRRSGAQQA